MRALEEFIKSKKFSWHEIANAASLFHINLWEEPLITRNNFSTCTYLLIAHQFCFPPGKNRESGYVGKEVESGLRGLKALIILKSYAVLKKFKQLKTKFICTFLVVLF